LDYVLHISETFPLKRMPSRFFETHDGLRLHYLDNQVAAQHLPLLCLAGLTRHSLDFEPVFELLKDDRRVIALDFRGRGKSQFADPNTYTAAVELDDTLQLLDHLGLSRVAVLGTSRGGIVGLLMAATVPQRIAGLMLNDVGPLIEAAGVARISQYVGRVAHFRSWNEAADALATLSTGFHGVTPTQWLTAARRIYVERDGAIASCHDPHLADLFPKPGQPIPDLWSIFDTIGDVEIDVIRGANSDLLSTATVAEMQRRRPRIVATQIPDRGHVPFLDEPLSAVAIRKFVARHETKKGT
jgi:pimeloyl-ACP methyl ester carboxylesterase